ncbi:MAG: hypothetical protein K1X75_01650 [Leptospirales bacterium]|nr:hypothetical protein [Leptospirales bacterium]
MTSSLRRLHRWLMPALPLVAGAAAGVALWQRAPQLENQRIAPALESAAPRAARPVHRAAQEQGSLRWQFHLLQAGADCYAQIKVSHGILPPEWLLYEGAEGPLPARGLPADALLLGPVGDGWRSWIVAAERCGVLHKPRQIILYSLLDQQAVAAAPLRSMPAL